MWLGGKGSVVSWGELWEVAGLCVGKVNQFGRKFIPRQISQLVRFHNQELDEIPCKLHSTEKPISTTADSNCPAGTF